MIASTKNVKKSLENGFCENGYSIWHRTHHHMNMIRYSDKISEATKIWCFQIVKNLNAKHCVMALILLTLGTIIYYTHYVESSPFVGYVPFTVNDLRCDLE